MQTYKSFDAEVFMKRKKISLIALDMDGTLLMSDKRIHPDTARDIAFAAEQGVHLVYCSGRDIVELDPYTGDLPLIRYGICTSGSIVYDFSDGGRELDCLRGTDGTHGRLSHGGL